MCTGLLATCICNHYQVLYRYNRCLENCLFPDQLVRVSFQCSNCDECEQEILELEIAAQVQVREAAQETNRTGAWERRGSWMRMSDAEREALRRMAAAEQSEKELAIAEELRGKIEKVTEEWRVALEEWKVCPGDRWDEM